jgi:hypothetical protein
MTAEAANMISFVMSRLAGGDVRFSPIFRTKRSKPAGVCTLDYVTRKDLAAHRLDRPDTVTCFR